MTTSEFIDELYNKVYKYYKKNCRNCEQGLKLDRKEPVEIDGNVFTGWREYTNFKVAEYIQDNLPEATVKVILDGNNSYVDLECNFEEQAKLNAKLNTILKGWN